VDVELRPEQAPAVTEVVAGLIEGTPPTPDPWWQAGIDEALET
jgi:hypothetical protein